MEEADQASDLQCPRRETGETLTLPQMLLCPCGRVRSTKPPWEGDVAVSVPGPQGHEADACAGFPAREGCPCRGRRQQEAVWRPWGFSGVKSHSHR